MKRNLLCAAILFICTLAASCVRRELTYDYRPWCEVRVDVDWTAFGQTPTGMTLICFPQDESAPVSITTTETTSTLVRLRPGKYDILVFNQSPEEFGTIGFRGMDRYETVEIFAREAESKWYRSEAGEEKAVLEPERLGIDRMEGFEVTVDMVEKSGGYAGSSANEAAAVTLHPQCIISKTLVKVKVKGIHNLRSVRGSMSGMAEGHFPTQGKTNEGKVTHLLEEWQISHDKSDYTYGETVVTFNTFGLPAGHPSAAADDIVVENKLNISFLLVDNKTVKNFQFNVADRIKPHEEEELTLVVEIGTSTGGDRPEDRPIEVEDVKPENGSEGGFDATVDNWGERIEIDIPI